MQDFLHTWRVALRRLRRDPGLTLLVLLSLSLGIGSATTAFSLVNALLLRPLPGIGEPEELVRITPRPVKIPGLLEGSFHVPLSYPTFRAYAQTHDAPVDLAAHQPVVVHAAVGERAQRLEGEIVSPNYFSLLRCIPAVGRLFATDPEHPEGRPDVVVLGHQLWKELGGDPRLVGTVIRIDGVPFTVIGVGPAGFHGTRVAANPQLWVPIAAASSVLPGMNGPQLHDPEQGWLFWFVGRLRNGVQIAAARERFDAIAQGLRDQGASDEQAAGLVIQDGIGLRPDEETSAAESLAILMTVVGFLLLIACMNTAILLLSRVPRRRKDLSLRLALGAQRPRVVREQFAESLVLGLAGAALGVLWSVLAARLLSRLDFAGFLPSVGRVVIDLRVLGFALSAGMACTLLFGVAPALRSSRVDLVSSLKQVPSGHAHGESLQHLLVIVQVGVSVILLVGTGLLARSFLNYQNVPLGFDDEHVLNLRFDLQRQGYGEGAGRAFLQRLLDEATSIPGVETASLAASVPLVREGERAVAQVSPATGPLAHETDGWFTYNIVGPSYLETLGIRLMRGREFGIHDDLDAPAVTFVNETLAARFWPGEDPVGQWLQMGGQELQVVGVAADSRTEGLTGAVEPHFYLPVFQHYEPLMTLHVRSNLDPASLLAQLESRFRTLDPLLPLFAEGPMARQVESVLGRPRLAVAFVGITAAMGLLLSLVGIGGVIYRTTKARLRETGIRLSMGASRAALLWLFLRRGLATTGIGLACGVAGAFAVSQTLDSFLYRVAPHDPWVFVLVVGLVAILATLATGVPAYYGTRIDPAEILREE